MLNMNVSIGIFYKVNSQMQPLLNENANIGAKEKQQTYVDAEQNDTAYVLMQMQKSKESLALKKS